MSDNYRTDIFLKRLYYIHEQCASARKKEDKADDIDNFAKIRKNLAQKIRETKQKINERDTHIKKDVSDEIVAKESADIRNNFQIIQADIEEFQAEKNKREKIIRNRSNEITPEEEEQIKLENEVVDAAWKHLEQLKNFERFGDDVEQQGLFANDEDESSEVNQQIYGSLPDIDDPKFQILREKDQVIDTGLDDVFEALKVVKNIAENMNNELKIQEELISKIDDSANSATEKIISANSSIKKVLNKVRGPGQCCCNLFLCLLILGVAAALIYLIIK